MAHRQSSVQATPPGPFNGGRERNSSISARQTTPNLVWSITGSFSFLLSSGEKELRTWVNDLPKDVLKNVLHLVFTKH